MKVRVDSAVCDGFGKCAGHAPNIFELDEWGYAIVKGDGAVPEGEEGPARRAAIDCPVQAIHIIDE
jgi:ferredoxin